MTYEWSTKFNVSPSGSDFGSVSGRIIRETKAAFYERLDAQHVITESATPQVTHEAGKSSVLKFGTSEEELQHMKPQSLFYDIETNTLYAYNKDAIPDAITSKTHSDYANLDADDHTQYAKELSEITGSLSVPEITNLGTSTSTPYILDSAVHEASDHYPIQEDNSFVANFNQINVNIQSILLEFETPVTYKSANNDDIPVGVVINAGNPVIGTLVYLDEEPTFSSMFIGFHLGNQAAIIEHSIRWTKETMILLTLNNE